MPRRNTAVSVSGTGARGSRCLTRKRTGAAPYFAPWTATDHCRAVHCGAQHSGATGCDHNRSNARVREPRRRCLHRHNRIQAKDGQIALRPVLPPRPTRHQPATTTARRTICAFTAIQTPSSAHWLSSDAAAQPTPI
jgi:hypothetical protein